MRPIPFQALLSCFAALLANLVAQESPAPTRPSVTVPAPRHDKNSKTAHEHLLAKTRLGRVDLYFIGDSITRRWGCTDPQWSELLAHWNETFHGWNAGNFAWGADGIQHMLWRLENGELEGLQPKVFVISAGTNNLGSRPAGPEGIADIVAGVEALIKRCRDKVPSAKIIVMGIFPRNDRGLALIPTINAINEGIAGLADPPDVTYLNINDKLAGPDGTLVEGMTVDKLHLSVAGYKVWAEALEPHLREFLGPRAATDQAPPPTGDPKIMKTYPPEEDPPSPE